MWGFRKLATELNGRRSTFPETPFTSTGVGEGVFYSGKPALQIQLIDLPLQAVSRSLVQSPYEVKRRGTKQKERQSADPSCLRKPFGNDRNQPGNKRQKIPFPNVAQQVTLAFQFSLVKGEASV
jgi:hypothetical protein